MLSTRLLNCFLLSVSLCVCVNCEGEILLIVFAVSVALFVIFATSIALSASFAVSATPIKGIMPTASSPTDNKSTRDKITLFPSVH